MDLGALWSGLGAFLVFFFGGGGAQGSMLVACFFCAGGARVRAFANSPHPIIYSPLCKWFLRMVYRIYGM